MDKVVSTINDIKWSLAKKHGLRMEQIEEIVHSQYSYIYDIIAKTDKHNIDSFKGTAVAHFGKFIPRWTRIAKYHKKAEETKLLYGSPTVKNSS